ncbi:putative ABC transporter permease protein [Ferrigenium kumadai]|uniref:ABC transporter permease protein n=1 Tax=Ferrigenium kumadai TaxID=1682490 RepID=A0AAN1SXT2_9PROT|nr:ABC transporter permease [Ferrigenium kumadai]BBI98920.1 putative ABC transporter permease protein [Ferrigenium kumadai]
MKNSLQRLQYRLGRQGLFVRDGLALTWQAFGSLPAISKLPVRHAFYKQLYFSGIQSIGYVGAIGFLSGLILVIQVHNLVGHNELLTLHVLIWIIVRELGPLLAAIVIISRSSSAIASELAAMQVNGEIDYLRRMAVSPVSYMAMPRILGMTLASLALAFYFQVVSIGTGMAVTAWMLDIALMNEVANFFDTISFLEIATALLKSICFGVIVSVVSCYYGLAVKRALTEIPKAASRAVIRSLLAVFACDGVITMLFF